MRPGPLRRLAGIIGLLALAPIAVMLVTGLLTPADAALRAGAVFLVVFLLSRFAGWWLHVLAGSFERDGDDAPGGQQGSVSQPGASPTAPPLPGMPPDAAEQSQAEAPRRRRSDQAAEVGSDT